MATRRRPSVILGLNFNGIDPSACIVIDGQLVVYCEEERFTREKKAEDRLPSASAAECLSLAGVTAGDITDIAYPWDAMSYSDGRMLRFYEGLNALHPPDDEMSMWQKDSLSRYSVKRLTWALSLLWRQIGGRTTLPKIHFIPHHLCHAVGAVLSSGFDESLVLVADGNGEQDSTSIWLASPSEIRRLHTITLPHSLGWFYSSITAFLGFVPGEDEYKVMGLASYGDRARFAEAFEELLPVEDSGDYRFPPRFSYCGLHNYSTQFTDELVELFGVRPRSGGDPPSDVHRDIAAGAQARLETVLIRMAAYWQDVVHAKRLCLNGGIALNCRANGLLSLSGMFEDVYALPMASDAGQAIGAALTVVWRHDPQARAPLHSTLLGPGYTPSAIHQVLDQCGLEYQVPKDIAETAARALLMGKIVGWFQGRMEGGPRALGARSILADPRYVSARDRVNKVVKYREAWRPFCPSVLAEYAELYFPGALKAPLMTHVLPVPEETARAVPAVVHVDGTSRPHVVEKERQPLYWRMLEAFRCLSGIPVVLNTSFNVKGEPIVATPSDAVRCFYATGLDALALGPYWLTKQNRRPIIENANMGVRFPRRTVRISAGTYPLGPEAAPVPLSAFDIDVYPVTNTQYATFLREVRLYGDDQWRHPRQPKNKNHLPQYWHDPPWNEDAAPVVGVDWWDAWAYASWSGGRLPTEIEWEAAAAGFERRTYPWGNEWNPARLNSKEFWGDDAWAKGRTWPVTRFPAGATPEGVYDLAGNTWEYTSTLFSPKWSNCPRTFDGSGMIVIKGGSFRRDRSWQTCVARDDTEVDCRGQNNSFRCVYRPDVE